MHFMTKKYLEASNVQILRAQTRLTIDHSPCLLLVRTYSPTSGGNVLLDSVNFNVQIRLLSAEQRFNLYNK